MLEFSNLKIVKSPLLPFEVGGQPFRVKTKRQSASPDMEILSPALGIRNRAIELCVSSVLPRGVEELHNPSNRKDLTLC